MTKRISVGDSTGSRVAVTTTAATVSNNLWKNMPTINVSNIGTAIIYVTFGGTATTTNGIPIFPNTYRVLTKGHEVTSLSVIGSAAGSDIHAIACGEGI